MNIHESSWIPLSPAHGSSMQLSDDPRSRGPDNETPALLPCVSKMKSSSYSTVQQQGYSASVFLQRREKLEQTQQKCIAIFALLCCFTILVVLIFSSVDIWGDDEDGITEENCSRDCRIVLVENIPEYLLLPVDGRPHLPLSVGFHTLLDQARRSVEVVSPAWDLNSWDMETPPSAAKQVQNQSRQYERIFNQLHFPGALGKEMQLFSSKSVCSVLMRLTLLR
uniref:Uncharacterized protein n=1 Tax=Echeneis naucrates TaxID=173247 RepID=A0A665SYI9_ECHNA